MRLQTVTHWNSFATVINLYSPILSVSVIFYWYLRLMLTIICLLLFPRQMGAYHTIELELNRKFTLAKKSWDSILLDRIGKQLLLFVFDWDFSEFYLVTPTTYYLCLVFAYFKHTNTHVSLTCQPQFLNRIPVASKESCLPFRDWMPICFFIIAKCSVYVSIF